MKLEQVCRFRAATGYTVCAQSPGFTADHEAEMGKLFNDTMNPLFGKVGQSLFTCAIGEKGTIFLSRSTLRSSYGRTAMFTHSYLLSPDDYEVLMEGSSGASLLSLSMEDMLYTQPASSNLPTLSFVPSNDIPDLDVLRKKYQLDDARYAQLLLGAYRAMTTSASLCLYTKRPLEETPVLVRELAYCIAEGLLPMLKKRLTYSSAADTRMKVCVSSSVGGHTLGKSGIPFDVDQGRSFPAIKIDSMSDTFFRALAHASVLERHAMLDKMQRWLSDLSDEGSGISLGMVVAAYYLSSGQSLINEEAARLLANLLSGAKGSGVNQQALDQVLAHLIDIINQGHACPNTLPQLVERYLFSVNPNYERAVSQLLTLAPVFACANLLQTLIKLTDQRSPKIKELVLQLLALIPPNAEELAPFISDLILWAVRQDVTELSDSCLQMSGQLSVDQKKALLCTILEEAQGRSFRMCESAILFPLINSLANQPNACLDDAHNAMLYERFPSLSIKEQQIVAGYCLFICIPLSKSPVPLLQKIALDYPPLFSALAFCLRNPDNKMLDLWESYQTDTLLKKGMGYEALEAACQSANIFFTTNGPFEKKVGQLWLDCLERQLDPNASMQELVGLTSQSVQRLEQARFSRNSAHEVTCEAADLMWTHLSYRSMLSEPSSVPEHLMVSQDPRATEKLKFFRILCKFIKDPTDITALSGIVFNNGSSYSHRDRNEIREHLYDLCCYLIQTQRFFSWDLLILRSYTQDEDGTYDYHCRMVAEDVEQMEEDGLIPDNLHAPLASSSFLREDEELRKEMRKFINYKSPRILQELGEELKSFSRSRQQKNRPFETPKESRKREAPEEHTEHDRRSSGGERTAKSPLGFLQGIFGHKPSSPPPSTSVLFGNDSHQQKKRGKGGKHLK